MAVSTKCLLKTFVETFDSFSPFPDHGAAQPGAGRSSLSSKSSTRSRPSGERPAALTHSLAGAPRFTAQVTNEAVSEEVPNAKETEAVPLPGWRDPRLPEAHRIPGPRPIPDVGLNSDINEGLGLEQAPLIPLPIVASGQESEISNGFPEMDAIVADDKTQVVVTSGDHRVTGILFSRNHLGAALLEQAILVPSNADGLSY